MRKERFTAAQVAHALTVTHGLVYLCAKRLKCQPQTIYNYCERYPSVQAARDAQRGQMVDLAEQKLWESIQNGEAWGITLCLKTLGKERGYVERQELSGQDGTPLTLKVVYEDAIDVTPELRLPESALGKHGTRKHEELLG